MSQQSFYDQLTAAGVPDDVADRASFDLAAGLGADESDYVCTAYFYLTGSEVQFLGPDDGAEYPLTPLEP